jgi:N-dimethylarginine dimethylaminohydrolase
MQTTTCHSDIGKIETVFIKNATHAFINTAHINNYWQQLNFLSNVHFDTAVKEYTYFEKALTQLGATLYYFDADNTVNMDAIYCRDASIATDKGMIICNMGKALRKNEPAAQKKAFEKMGIPILGVIEAPGTVEGGDVAWLDANTLAVGHTYRTNAIGIMQLTKLLQPLNVQVITVDLPHYKGVDDVFHLMSIFSPIDTNKAVVYSPLMPITFRNLLISKGYQLIEVPDNEFETMGCNVLALAPSNCLMVSGNPITEKRIKDAGCIVTTYIGNEISVKGGGGPTCLTRPMLRCI